jgi:hypothetical protein
VTAAPVIEQPPIIDPPPIQRGRAATLLVG